MGASTGWITSLTGWLDEKYQQATTWFAETIANPALEFFAEMYTASIDAVRTALHDMLIAWLDSAFELLKVAVYALPAPEFLQGLSLNDVFSQGGPWVQFIVGQLRLGECLSIIGAAYVFRMLRKLFTFGLW